MSYPNHLTRFSNESYKHFIAKEDSEAFDRNSQLQYFLEQLEIDRSEKTFTIFEMEISEMELSSFQNPLLGLKRYLHTHFMNSRILYNRRP